MRPLVFLLLPFVALPLPPIASTLGLIDAAKILCLLLGLHALLTLTRAEFQLLRYWFTVYVVLLVVDLVALAAFFQDSRVEMISVFKLSYFLLGLVLLPLLGFYRLMTLSEQADLRKLYWLPVWIVIGVSLLQLICMLAPSSPISAIYKGGLYYYLEGRWGGAQAVGDDSLAQATQAPMVTATWRLSGTFQEPSVLGIFFLLYYFPLAFASLITGTTIYSRLVDRLLMCLVFVSLAFALSSTAYLGIAVDILLFAVLSLKARRGGKAILLIMVGMGVAGAMAIDQIERFVQALSKLIEITSVSSSSRFGSMAAAFNLFADYPFGIGYANSKAMLYQYLPVWGQTEETVGGAVVLHSSLARIAVEFGAPGLLMLGVMLVRLCSRIRNYRPLEDQTARIALIFWVINLCMLGVSDIQLEAQWFLCSAMFTIWPVLKAARQKQLLATECAA